MKLLLLSSVFGLCVLIGVAFVSEARTRAYAPATLHNIIIADGNNSIPCDGVGHWTPLVPVHANIAKAYLFFSMSPNSVNGADVMLGDQVGHNDPVAEVHLLQRSPSTGVQGEHRESFTPDRVYRDQLGICVVCWGGGNALAYADVWVD